MNDPITKGAVERVARIIAGDEVADLAAANNLGSLGRELWSDALAKAEAVLTTLNLGELVTALGAAKQELWLTARGSWTMADFKNWAVVQQIDTALARFRGGVSG